MIYHYLKIAFRNLWKHKTQSFAGIFSLAFGLACFVPALYWMRYETSYDGFYPDAENIYRIYIVEKQSGKVNEHVPGILERKLHEQFPAMEISTRFIDGEDNYSTEETPYIRLNTLMTDSAFFRVFPQVIVSGNARQPMQTLHDMVLTESVAVRLFGDAEKAIGQQIKSTAFFFVFGWVCTVTAVVKDPPPNTNLPFDAVLFSDIQDYLFSKSEVEQWIRFDNQMYVKLHPHTDVDKLAEELRDFTSRIEANTHIELRMLPVGDVRHRLYTDLPFTLNFIWLFVAAGVLLLFSALFNFLNFHLDLFRQRIRELRQRTVHGATGGRLIVQMMFELACTIFLALTLACCFILLVRPVLSGLLDIEIEMPQLMYLFFVCGILVTVLILFIGLIPFWRLGRLALRDLAKRQSTGQPVLRRMAVSLQLAVSIIFIVAALVVMMQMRFVNRKDLGFDRSGVIQLSGFLEVTFDMHIQLWPTMLRELTAIPQIENITGTYFEPQHTARYGPMSSMTTEVEWPGKPPHERPAFQFITSDSQFPETFRLKMLMGKWWKEGEKQKVVLNEEAVRVIGLSNPVGTMIHMSYGNDSRIQEYEVVGVVNDFHTLSLRSRIHPTIFIKGVSNILYIRVIPGSENEVMQRITTLLPSLEPSLEEAYMTPLDELYERLNHSEQVGLKMFSVMASVCLLISLSGIYAVATASTRRRRKEIAIRKISGAEVSDIVRIFFREHILQVVIAGVIALPLAYLAMNRWLQGYAYHTNIPWWLLVGVIMAVVVLVLFTVLGQVLKAANGNPAEVVKEDN